MSRPLTYKTYKRMIRNLTSAHPNPNLVVLRINHLDLIRSRWHKHKHNRAQQNRHALCLQTTVPKNNRLHVQTLCASCANNALAPKYGACTRHYRSAHKNTIIRKAAARMGKGFSFAFKITACACTLQPHVHIATARAQLPAQLHPQWIGRQAGVHASHF